MKNKDEQQKEKKQIMLQWKKAYIEAIIDALQPKGDVLQVGFDHSYAADRIQTFKPKSHTIMENDPQLVNEAKAWSKKYSNVSIIEGSWQTRLASLGVFDTIYLNDYPIDSEIGILNRINPEEIKKTSSQAKELLSKLENQLSQMTMHYSDQEIEDFFEKKGQFNLGEMPSFFSKLKEYGYITEKQYHNALKKFHINKAKEEENIKESDSTFTFLDASLKNHMRQGSRFSCFSNDIVSKYEDSQFFENVITNPFIDYHENVVSIKVPNFSEHYKFNEALILVVEKFS